jgi:hypothetical protein
MPASPAKCRTGIVDVPNAVATLAVPLRIFSVDVRPKKLMPGVSVKVFLSTSVPIFFGMCARA